MPLGLLYTLYTVLHTFVGIYSDVIDKVDKEPPFDLHAYLTPPPTSTSTTLSTETIGAVTTTISSTTTAATTTTTSTGTPPPAATAAAVDKPKKEPSKPKLYVPSSL